LRLNIHPRSTELFFVLVLIGAFAWRPFYLGYYGDDWYLWADVSQRTSAFSSERWDALNIAGNRPFLRAALFFLGSLVSPGIHAAYWQTVAIVFSLVSGFTLFFFMRSLCALLLNVQKTAVNRASGFAALCWCLFPWGVTVSFWPTGTITGYLSLICFAISSLLLIDFWSKGTRPVIAGAFVSLLGYLAYEGFYFQVIPLIFLLLWKRKVPISRSAFTIGCYLTAFVIASGFNHWMRLAGAEGSRKINSHFLEVYFHWPLWVGKHLGISHMLVYGSILLLAALTAIYCARAIRSRHPLCALSFGEIFSLSLLWIVALCPLLALPVSMPELGLGVLAFLIFSCWKTFSQWNFGKEQGTLSIVLLFLATELILGSLVFALGNYVMFSAGIGGRTTLAVNIWIACAFAIGYFKLTEFPFRRVTNSIIGILLILSLLGSLLLRGKEWANSWQIQLEVVNNPEPVDLNEIKPNTHFIFIGPEQSGWVPAFENNWITASAFAWAYGKQAKVANREDLVLSEKQWTERWLVHRTGHTQISWDGVYLLQLSCRDNKSQIFHAKTHEVWVWRFKRGFVRQTHPFTMRCNDSWVNTIAQPSASDKI
jgi:hypothetical protein